MPSRDIDGAITDEMVNALRDAWECTTCGDEYGMEDVEYHDKAVCSSCYHAEDGEWLPPEARHIERDSTTFVGGRVRKRRSSREIHTGRHIGASSVPRVPSDSKERLSSEDARYTNSNKRVLEGAYRPATEDDASSFGYDGGAIVPIDSSDEITLEQASN